MEERELDCSDGPPLVGWRFFRVRRGANGPMLAAPLIHNPDFELFPSKEIVARCYAQDHPAPAPSCRCGLYVAIEGTLDSLAGYLLDSAHDRDPVVYAEVACSGRLFVDKRGVRAERINILRLAASLSAWPDRDAHAEAVTALYGRHGIAICDLDAVPEWVQSNVMPQARHRTTRRSTSTPSCSASGAQMISDPPIVGNLASRHHGRVQVDPSPAIWDSWPA